MRQAVPKVLDDGFLSWVEGGNVISLGRWRRFVLFTQRWCLRPHVNGYVR